MVTIPLIQLAAGAVAAGWFGIPAVLGGSNHWAHFLEPVLGHPHMHLSHGVELLLMATSVLAAAGGIALAWYLYRLRPELPGALAGRFAGLHRLLVNKYFVDEAYIGLIVKPTLAFGRGVLLKVADIGIIDGVVNGLPRLIGRLSERMRLVQDGQVSHYLAWIGGGAVLLLAFLITGL